MVRRRMPEWREEGRERGSALACTPLLKGLTWYTTGMTRFMPTRTGSSKGMCSKNLGRGQGQGWGTAGDGARALLPWDGRPRRAENFDPEHLLAGNSKGRSLAALVVCLIQFVCLYTQIRRVGSHPPADSPPSLLSARSLCNVFGSRRKSEPNFSMGCTEHVRCPVVCKLSVVPTLPPKKQIPTPTFGV